MATQAFIPVQEYLGTAYHPDCEYLNGILEERNVGEKPHGFLQGILFSIFDNNLPEWNLMPILEQRVQTLPTSYRVPDLCLVGPGEGDLEIVTKPPALCIEVLSQGDSLRGTLPKATEFLEMGVAVVWILDPWERTAYVVTAQGQMQEHHTLSLPGTPAWIPLETLFKKLDARLAF